MNLLRALAVGVRTYLLIFLAMIVSPLIFLLMAWSGLCLLGAAFLFFFWLFITHRPTELNGVLMLLVSGAPPFLLASALGYFRGLRQTRRQQAVSLRQDAHFR